MEDVVEHFLFGRLICCRRATLFLLGLRPTFSRIVCCLDFMKKVTILCNTTTDVRMSEFGVRSIHLPRNSLLVDNRSRQNFKMFSFSLRIFSGLNKFSANLCRSIKKGMTCSYIPKSVAVIWLFLVFS